MEGDCGTDVQYSVAFEVNYSTDPAGGDTEYQPSDQAHHQSYDQQFNSEAEQHHTYEPQEYNQEVQQEQPQNQPSGAAAAAVRGGNTGYSAQGQRGPGAPRHGGPPPNQQGGYQGPKNNPNFATGPPPPMYNPRPRPPTNDPYPPQRPNPNVYPPQNPGPAPVHPPPKPQQQPYNGQAVPPSRPLPPIQPTPGLVSSIPIIQQIIRPEIGPPEAWASEIFGFLEDCYGCPLVILAPCITFGQIAEIVDTGYNRCQTAGIIYAMAFFLGIPCLYSYTYRTKMRHRFNLREDPLDDFCTHFWCEWCALAQEYREIRYRGIDPSLGYDMQRDAVKNAMEAPVPPRMQVQPPQNNSTMPPHKPI